MVRLFNLRVLTTIASLTVSNFGTSRLHAADQTSISQRMSVVGVIAESDPSGRQGIAVLKDSRGGRTFAVQTGESVPGEPTMVVKSVRRNEVLVSNGQEQFTLTYFDAGSANPTGGNSANDGNSSAGSYAKKESSDADSGFLVTINPHNSRDVSIPENTPPSTTVVNQPGSSGVREDSTGYSQTYFDEADAVEWYDTSDTAAEIIERLNEIAPESPRDNNMAVEITPESASPVVSDATTPVNPETPQY